MYSALKFSFDHDRSGACVVAALVDRGGVERAAFFPEHLGDQQLTYDSAVEVGSITKTMVAFLAAELARDGDWNLDAPAQAFLPKGWTLPLSIGRQISLRQLLTHTSGLPSITPGLITGTIGDPYGGLTEGILAAELRKLELRQGGQEKYKYSNLGYMLLSLMISNHYGLSLESILRRNLFEPLGMVRSFVNIQNANGTAVAPGHLSNGRSTGGWSSVGNLSGFGSVHSTLNDMVKYVRANLGLPTCGRISELLKSTHIALGEALGMSWQVVQGQQERVIFHEGATGGYSSFVGLMPEQERGVVLLTDTSLIDLGGLNRIGLHLLGLDVPAPAPRFARSSVPSEILASIGGSYDYEGKVLEVRASQVPGIQFRIDENDWGDLHFDSYGDFYSEIIGAVISPAVSNGRVNGLTLKQGGSAIYAPRLGGVSVDESLLFEWVGRYEMTEKFSIVVSSRGGRIYAQGTGQPEVELHVTGAEILETAGVAARIEFHRSREMKIDGLFLSQAGRRHWARRTREVNQ